MRKKTGDTLVEVTLAIGIFSMVAVAVVTVVNNSTSRAQTALETTLAREEIDAQAEAIRFVQNAYTSYLRARDGDEWCYAVWNKMVQFAITVEDSDALSYRPQTCDELYEEDDLIDANGNPRVFIADPQNIDHYSATQGGYYGVSYPGTYGTQYNDRRALFQPTTTYPNLIYGTGAKDRNPIAVANGIYVIAVKGSDSFIGYDGERYPTYYDFYIRTCWYGLGAKLPSTISTVIRLANPEYLVPAST